MKEFLKRKKTYILAGLMILHGFVMFVAGDQTFIQFIQGSQQFYEVFGGATMATYRAAIDV